MSFSATPLGQSRRLGHSTFLGTRPEKWTVKDTSVNIATAFTQAATDMNPTHTNLNNSWLSKSRRNLNVPCSTSVEYEATAPTASNREHLATPPPDRHGRTTASESRAFFPSFFFFVFSVFPLASGWFRASKNSETHRSNSDAHWSSIWIVQAVKLEECDSCIQGLYNNLGILVKFLTFSRQLLLLLIVDSKHIPVGQF